MEDLICGSLLFAVALQTSLIQEGNRKSGMLKPTLRRLYVEEGLSPKGIAPATGSTIVPSPSGSGSRGTT